MIPIVPAPAPADFDQRVRRKGLDAIAELVGEAPSRKRPGRKRRQTFASRADIPPDKFPPYWRDVLSDMLDSYRRLCAYLALYIEPATGSPTVDHVVRFCLRRRAAAIMPLLNGARVTSLPPRR